MSTADESVQKAGSGARRALAVVRIVNGLVALLAPQLIIRRFEPPAGAGDAAAVYGLRLFGVRTVVIGADLLTLRDEALSRSVRQAVVVHATDTLTAASLAAAGRLPRRSAVLLPLISAVNTVLAVLAWRSARRGGPR